MYKQYFINSIFTYRKDFLKCNLEKIKSDLGEII